MIMAEEKYPESPVEGSICVSTCTGGTMLGDLLSADTL